MTDTETRKTASPWRRRAWILVPAALLALAAAAVFLVPGALPAVRHMSGHVLVFMGFKDPARLDAIYWCPMHPFYKVGRYGICPYCNMELEPYEPGLADETDPTVLVLTGEEMQQAGVRTDEVKKRRLVRETLTAGMLREDRERYYHVDVRFGGWIEELFVFAEGDPLPAGAPVARVYSPELYTAQQEHLVAREHSPDLAAATRQRLVLLGLDGREIRELEERGTPSARTLIRSPLPFDGTVVHLNVKPGQRIPPDGHIADVADLSRLWLFADVYPGEYGRVRPGSEVAFTVEAHPEKVFRAEVDLLEPEVRAQVQTLRVRASVENPDGLLRPGQFARVLLSDDSGDVLSVHELAVIPTGRRDLVVVALGAGRFQAREVHVGRRGLTLPGADAAGEDRGLEFFTGHRRYHEVLAGLDEGEKAVTSGSFLLHAETQIRGLMEKTFEPRDPAEEEEPALRSAWSGEPIPGAPHSMTHEGEELHFLDHQEMTAFQADPEASWWAFARGVGRLRLETLEAYLELHAAMGRQDLSAAREQAGVMEGLLPSWKELEEKARRPEEAGEAREVAEKLREGAAAIRAAERFRDSMPGFGMLSAALEALLERHGVPEGFEGPLYHFQCGMAHGFGSPTESWFQTGEILESPYAMPGCGRLEKKLQ